MRDEQMERLMDNAKGTFVAELKGKTDDICVFLDAAPDEWSEDERGRLKRFFHSLRGTASTLGLDYLRLLGEECESKLDRLYEGDGPKEEAFLRDIRRAVARIQYQVDQILSQERASFLPEGQEYTNMLCRGKVLLIDDDIAILKLLENSFSSEGYKVYICDDSSMAMDTIAMTKPDIVILDIMMPKLSGFDILEKIKSREEYSDTYVIFLSAKEDSEDRIRGIEAGADDYITKPFVIKEVITRVEMIMRRSKKYKEKLLRDCLTGAYSKYYFNLRMAEEFERFKRNGALFSIAFIDLDHYKGVNDEYGHQTGDYVLGVVSHYLSKNIRKCDSVYRFGGEEFVIIFPDTVEERAFYVTERLRKGLSHEPITVGGNTVFITFSAGIREARLEDEDVEEIINDADRAMYYAKRCGRNRVAIFDGQVELKKSSKTLLVVDDENTILKFLRDRLTRAGYNIITTESGVEAMRLAKVHKPDAIVLDLILPDIDGFEVCKRLKANDDTCASKIIMLSKRTQTQDIVEGLYLGADDYITKPFSVEELEARIMRVLNSTY